MKKILLLFLLVIIAAHPGSALDDETSNETSDSYQSPPKKCGRPRKFGNLVDTASKKNRQNEKNITTKKRNITCHFCRKNTRTRNSRPNYCQKLGCKMVFCDLCLKKRGQKIDPCLVCTGHCCCLYEDCKKVHDHCYTYRRTKKRHDAMGGCSKKKKRKNQTRLSAEQEHEKPVPLVFPNEAEKDEEFKQPFVDDNVEDIPPKIAHKEQKKEEALPLVFANNTEKDDKCNSSFVDNEIQKTLSKISCEEQKQEEAFPLVFPKNIEIDDGLKSYFVDGQTLLESSEQADFLLPLIFPKNLGKDEAFEGPFVDDDNGKISSHIMFCLDKNGAEELFKQLGCFLKK